MESLVEIRDGRPVITSRKIAELFGKEHRNVLQAIRNLVAQGESNPRNFVQRDFKDAKGRVHPEYVVTEAGALMLVLGFTGPRMREAKTKLVAALERQFGDSQAVLDALAEFEMPDDLPDMYLYVIRNIQTGNLKVGISKCPAERLKQLQVGNDGELELVATRRAGNRFADETKAHKNLAGSHVRGEWYAADFNPQKALT